MEFGISKCGVLVMKKGKLIHSEGIEIPSGDRIKEIDADDGYKYLGTNTWKQITLKTLK